MDKSATSTKDPAWNALYRIGGVAPLITLALYISQVVFISWDRFPSTTHDWFSLFQHNKLLGLFYINALDMVSIALLGPMFLALYIALKRDSESCMAIAALFAFLGIAVFIAPRSATLSLLSLSDRYAAATTAAQRAQTLAAGEAVTALLQPTPLTTGFLLMAVAVLITSVVMLRSNVFGNVTAYAGILASALTLADNVSQVLLPSITDLLMGIAGVFWVGWWILIARRLLQLGTYFSAERVDPE